MAITLNPNYPENIRNHVLKMRSEGKSYEEIGEAVGLTSMEARSEVMSALREVEHHPGEAGENRVN